MAKALSDGMFASEGECSSEVEMTYSKMTLSLSFEHIKEAVLRKDKSKKEQGHCHMEED